MLQEIGLYPGQLRALRARGRELLLAAEPRAGASHLLRSLAILRAALQERTAVVIASPDDRTLREEHMEGDGGIWRLLESLPTGTVRWHPGGLARLDNGSTIKLTTWEGAGRQSADLLLIDDGDELERLDYLRLRERVLQGPAADEQQPRVVLVAKRPGVGWVAEHWRALEGAGGQAQMAESELPIRLRGAPRLVHVESFGDWICRALPGFRFYPHVDLMVRTAQRVIDGEILRLLVSAPPRYFKSLVWSRLLPAYFLAQRPYEWASVVCAAMDLAKIMSSDARDFYRATGNAFRQDSKNKALWRTLRGGGMSARGVGGWILGIGYNLGVVDDPFTSPAEALKQSVQEEVETYFWDTYYGRRELAGSRPAAIVVNHQRLAEGDLLGRILKRERSGQHPPEGWFLLNLPAIKRPRKEAFPPSIKQIPDLRQDGEALCPELQEQDTASLERLEAINKLLFAATHQQEPIADAGGGLFGERWWWSLACHPERILAAVREAVGFALRPPRLSELLDLLMQQSIIPVMVRDCRAWDIAASLRGEGDASASTRGGITRMREVIFTDAFERYAPAALVEDLIIETAQQDGFGVEVILPNEPAAAGKIFTTKLQIRLQDLGFHCTIVPTSGSKYVRAMPHAGAAAPHADGRMGRCYLLPAAWNDLFMDRHHKFDGVTKPLDLVDSSSYLFSELELSSFLTSGIR